MALAGSRGAAAPAVVAVAAPAAWRSPHTPAVAATAAAAGRVRLLARHHMQAAALAVVPNVGQWPWAASPATPAQARWVQSHSRRCPRSQQRLGAALPRAPPPLALPPAAPGCLLAPAVGTRPPKCRVACLVGGAGRGHPRARCTRRPEFWGWVGVGGGAGISLEEEERLHNCKVTARLQDAAPHVRRAAPHSLSNSRIHPPEHSAAQSSSTHLWQCWRKQRLVGLPHQLGDAV